MMRSFWVTVGAAFAVVSLAACSSNKTSHVECGDGICSPTEGCATCPKDCGCQAGYACDAKTNACFKRCGDGKCEADQGENCTNCPADCGCADSAQCLAGVCQPYCGDGKCEPSRGENCATCPADCGCNSLQECHDGTCRLKCGNGLCDPGEGCVTCPEDCPCTGPMHICTQSNTCENTCGNGHCDTDLGENCTNCPQDCACGADEECVSGSCQSHCGNGKCEADYGENCSTCPQDCGCGSMQACVSGACQNSCGNGQCQASLGENCTTCPQDCGCTGGATCQAGICQATCSPNTPCALSFNHPSDLVVSTSPVVVGGAVAVDPSGAVYVGYGAVVDPNDASFPVRKLSGNAFVDAGTANTTGYFYGPRNLLALATGSLFAEWESETTKAHLYTATSTNGGGSWTAAQQLDVSPPSDEGDWDFATVANDVIYESYSGYVTGCTGSAGSCWKTFFTKSLDNGASWSTPLQLDKDAAQDDATSVAVQGEDIAVAWNTFDGNINLAFSSNGGGTFSTPVPVNDVAGKAHVNEAAFVAMSGSHVYVVWSDQRTVYNGQIYLAVATVGSDGTLGSWQVEGPIAPAANPYQQWPTVEVAPDGRLWILWIDLRNNNEADVYATATTDGQCFCGAVRFNQTFTPAPTRGNDLEGERFVIGADGTLHAVWRVDHNGATAGTYDIGYNSATPQ